MKILMDYWAVIMLSLPVYVFTSLVLIGELRRREKNNK